MLDFHRLTAVKSTILGNLTALIRKAQEFGNDDPEATVAAMKTIIGHTDVEGDRPIDLFVQDARGVLDTLEAYAGHHAELVPFIEKVRKQVAALSDTPDGEKRLFDAAASVLKPLGGIQLAIAKLPAEARTDLFTVDENRPVKPGFADAVEYMVDTIERRLGDREEFGGIDFSVVRSRIADYRAVQAEVGDDVVLPVAPQ